MNAKKLIMEAQEIFDNAQEWAKKEIENCENTIKDEKECNIEQIKNMIEELRSCATWEEAEDIANRYII